MTLLLQFFDILTLTAGGNIGTGAEDSVKGAKPILTTRTASRVIADVYAVRADWFKANRDRVKSMAKTLLEEQKFFRDHLDNIAKKNQPIKLSFANSNGCPVLLPGLSFLTKRPLMISFSGWDSIANCACFQEMMSFWQRKKPCWLCGGKQTHPSLLHFRWANFLSTYPTAASFKWFESTSLAAPVVAMKPVFSSAQAVRSAAEAPMPVRFSATPLGFPPRWRICVARLPDVFNTIHEKVTRYGGAVVQLRGHSDNFL